MLQVAQTAKKVYLCSGLSGPARESRDPANMHKKKAKALSLDLAYEKRNLKALSEPPIFVKLARHQ